MGDNPTPDWDPLAREVAQDQLAAYDHMRETCPVAYSELMGWSLFRHADVLAALLDHETFSNVVSPRRNVPNGLDPPEHTPYRPIVERYFTPAMMEAFEPQCRAIARQLVAPLVGRDQIDAMHDLGHPFAVRVQCDFLGWPARMQEPLHHWMLKGHGATLAQDRTAMNELAEEFEAYVDELLKARRDAGRQAPDDLTTDLMMQQVDGRPLVRDEIVSILRNWTAGEVGTISAAVGILLEFLATHPDIQQALRRHPSQIVAAQDEILRLHGPLVLNRRMTTRQVEIGGRTIAAGQRVSLNWIAANRDPRVFDNAHEYRLDRNPGEYLLYGAGIHVCPGAPLARLELRVLMEELLSSTRSIALAPEGAVVRACYPTSGFAMLPVVLR